MKKWLMSCAVLFLVVLTINNVSAITISATATGDYPFQTTGLIPVEGGTVSVINGDFTITQTSPANYNYPVVGDALNEVTTWFFDFTDDPNYASFPGSEPLSSARFIIEYYYGIQSNNDNLFPQGTTGIYIPEIRNENDILGLNYPNLIYRRVEFDLLGYYGNLLTIFNDNNGMIPMQYDDDALVVYAELKLTSSPVPEPATMLLFGTGLIGLAGVARRKKK